MSLFQVTPSRVAGFALGVIVGTLVMVASAAAAEVDSQVIAQQGKQASVSDNTQGWYSRSQALNEVLDTCDGPGMSAYKGDVEALRVEARKALLSMDEAIKTSGSAVLREEAATDGKSQFLRLVAAAQVYATTLISAGECNEKTASAAAQAARQIALSEVKCEINPHAFLFDEVVVCDGKPFPMPR